MALSPYAVVLGTIVLIALILIAKYINVANTNSLNAIPGPWHSKFTNLGLKLATIGGKRIYYVHSLHERYGPFVRLTPREISVADPKAFAQIHAITSGFNKSQWYMDLVPFERPTVFTMTNPKLHSVRRKLLARAFSKTYLRQHWELVVREKVQLTVRKMKTEAKLGVADVLKWWTLMATDTATHLMFGNSFQMIEQGRTNKYIRVLQNALQGSGISLEIPIIRTIGQWIPVATFQEMFNGTPFLMEYGRKAITNNKSETDGKSIFTNIVNEAEKGERLDEVDVTLEATGLIVAGSDTTAISLTYLTWVVLSKPALQIALQNEVATLPENFDDQTLEKLPILNAVIEETLRLYGAAPGGLPRTVPAEGASMGGFLLPGGTTVTTQAYTLHRDPRIYKDPFRFDHTRWLKSGEATTTTPDDSATPKVFHPFGAGSRVCIGIHLARMELRYGAAEFFRQCQTAKLAPSTTTESMEMDNYFLVAPKSHRCEITMG